MKCERCNGSGRIIGNRHSFSPEINDYEIIKVPVLCRKCDGTGKEKKEKLPALSKEWVQKQDRRKIWDVK